MTILNYTAFTFFIWPERSITQREATERWWELNTVFAYC